MRNPRYSPKSPRKRLRTPAITRAKNWTWYAVVKHRASDNEALNTDTQLDNAFVRRTSRGLIKGANAPRAFSRIRHLGTDPSHFEVEGIFYDLVAWVDRAPKQEQFPAGLPGTKRVHDSIFWGLMSGARPDLAKIRELAHQLAASRSLYRFDATAIAIARKKRWSARAFVPNLSNDNFDNIATFSRTGDLDDLAFIALLYIEAFETGLLEHAIFLRNLLKGGLHNFFRQNHIPIHLAKLVGDLVGACIIINAGDWVRRATLPSNWSPYKCTDDQKTSDFFRGFVTLPLLTDDFEQALPWVLLNQKVESHIIEIQQLTKQWGSHAEALVRGQAEKMIARMMIMQNLDKTLNTEPKDLDYRIVFRGYPWTMRTEK